MLKRHRSTLEFLPHDVVELILERLAVKSLLRFKAVSKQWKSTIESESFKEAQFIQSKLSRGPDVLYVSRLRIKDEALRNGIVLGSSTISAVRFPTCNTMVSHGSCDGLVCLFCVNRHTIVVNPATRWHQSIPLSCVQQYMYKNKVRQHPPRHNLGFGKDKFTGTYKLVWLFNSSEFGLQNATTCEVFDFSTNAWRYVLPASPHRILGYQKPVYLDGSLYWLTEGEETNNVLSFDLHTETFQVICKAPFSPVLDPQQVTMCILDNRLCVSHKNWPTQIIWSFGSTWNKLCSIDLTKTFAIAQEYCEYLPSPVALPIAILDKNKLLFGLDRLGELVVHDLHTKSYDLLFSFTTIPGHFVCYYQTLFSISSN